MRALDGVAADAVIHETNRLRTIGTHHLLDAARLVGATRIVTQSMIFGYGFFDHGEAMISEDAPFSRPSGARPDMATAAFASAEQQVLAADDIEGVALRYGFVYGPGPASERIVALLRARRFPVPRGGGGRFGWLWHTDAATATRAALERGKPGEAYNVVDDRPATRAEMFDAMAEALGAPRPRRVPAWLLRLGRRS